MKIRAISESVTDLQKYLSEKYNLDYLWLSEGPDHIKIGNIRVKPEDRGQGIGSAVLNKIKEYAMSVGKPIILTTQPEKGKKMALDRFYRRHEFRKPGRHKDYSLPLHTRIWRSR